MQDELLQLASFKLGDDKYAIDIMCIKEITRLQPIKRVPKAPGFVEGVINLRGSIIPVLDLRKRFDVQTVIDKKKNRIFIVTILKKPVGLLVDEATEVIRISPHQVKRAPEFAKTKESQFFKGVFDKNGELIFILDLDQILTVQEKSGLNEMRQQGV
jgi:purine-binding chemotaxis protein CheW